MHELAIAQSIAETVEARAVECQAARVKRVRLQIGEASGIMTDALAFCFEMVASLEPLLAGAQLSIETTPHRARCHGCGTEFSVVQFVRQCPACEAWDTQVISGTELQIVDMEIEGLRKG
jgi:hydrogenase nickel incorporation protein HypA/HybF